jgi:hypothetical protein
MDQESGTVTTASPATEEIRAEIEQTRAEMSDTIDAIQDRLSPKGLVSSAAEKLKDTSSRYTRRAMGVVTANPVPTALLGVAAAALTLGAWMRSRNGHSRDWDLADQSATATRSIGLGRNTRTLLLGACAGVACWSAWRART